MRLVDADAIIQKLPYSPEEMSITSVLSQEKPKYITPTVMRAGSVISIIQNTPTINPWVKTSDRLPTEADANKELLVLGWNASLGYREVNYMFIATYPHYIPWWMPIPSLPEVEE